MGHIYRGSEQLEMGKEAENTKQGEKKQPQGSGSLKVERRTLRGGGRRGRQ